MVKCEFWQSIVTAGHIYLSCSASKLLRLKPIWYAIVLEEVGWTERGQEGGYHWLLKLLPLHFRKKHDFYQFFFSFQLKGFCIPSIFFLCIIFCAHTVQIYLPVLFRPLFIFFNMNCFFFFYHPTHCLRRLLSSAAVFMLGKCNILCSSFFLVCHYKANYSRGACMHGSTCLNQNLLPTRHSVTLDNMKAGMWVPCED